MFWPQTCATMYCHQCPQIVRNLTDASRYDMSPRITSCLGLDTRQDSSLRRDRAIVELGVAVLHSFKEAGMGACTWLAVCR
jgi:nitric oxide synthase oxygenase domain/subunit